MGGHLINRIQNRLSQGTDIGGAGGNSNRVPGSWDSYQWNFVS
jgi:hypothetical protein